MMVMRVAILCRQWYGNSQVIESDPCVSLALTANVRFIVVKSDYWNAPPTARFLVDATVIGQTTHHHVDHGTTVQGDENQTTETGEAHATETTVANTEYRIFYRRR